MERSTDNLYDKYSGVYELVSNDFKIEKNKVTVINKNFKEKYGLIIFYAPWCGHCQKQVDTLTDIALQFSHSFTIGAVNCENKDNYKICSKINVKYYPTFMKVSKKGILSKYQVKGRTNSDKNTFSNDNKKDDLIYYICTHI